MGMGFTLPSRRIMRRKGSEQYNKYLEEGDKGTDIDYKDYHKEMRNYYGKQNPLEIVKGLSKIDKKDQSSSDEEQKDNEKLPVNSSKQSNNLDAEKAAKALSKLNLGDLKTELNKPKVNIEKKPKKKKVLSLI